MLRASQKGFERLLRRSSRPSGKYATRIEDARMKIQNFRRFILQFFIERTRCRKILGNIARAFVV
jgi:hypothetical protein